MRSHNFILSILQMGLKPTTFCSEDICSTIELLKQMAQFSDCGINSLNSIWHINWTADIFFQFTPRALYRSRLVHDMPLIGEKCQQYTAANKWVSYKKLRNCVSVTLITNTNIAPAGESSTPICSIWYRARFLEWMLTQKQRCGALNMVEATT